MASIVLVGFWLAGQLSKKAQKRAEIKKIII
jgi:hypothetical protein